MRTIAKTDNRRRRERFLNDFVRIYRTLSNLEAIYKHILKKRPHNLTYKGHFKTKSIQNIAKWKNA